MVPRVKELYEKKAVPELMKKFGYKNILAVPRLVKIVVNMGIGKDNKEAKAVTSAQKELSLITGQKPIITLAKKSIAGFNLRKGAICGVSVTLRRKRMYEFFDRLVTVGLPRVRDFQGLSPKSFDLKGNYTLGIKEQIIFPEVDYDVIFKVRGMNVTFATTAKNPEEARELLKLLGLPISDKTSSKN